MDPLVLPCAAVVTGILLGRALSFTTLEAAWPVAAFLALAVFTRASREPSHWLRRACVLCALVFAGTLSYVLHRPLPPPEIDAGVRETVLLDGCVVEPTVFSPGREQFTLELAWRARARVTLPLDETAVVDPGAPQRLSYGQRVEVEARVRSPHNYNNPGGFDYVSYLARQDIFWTASMTQGSHATILPGRCGSKFVSMVYALRTGALERLDRLYPGDPYAASMMQAILIGETSGLERAWTEDFRRTGTFHALVISGVHVTVLAGVLLFLLRACGVPQLGALGATSAAAWLYALVSGLSAPVVRAAAGFSLFLIARFLFRRTRILNLLAAIALVYTIWDPDSLFDASFQLSFLSVAAIAALAGPILDPRIAPLSRGVRSLSDVARDIHLDRHTAHARVELRLAAETLALWTHLPQSGAELITEWLSRFGFFALQMAILSTVIQIGLALPMAEYFHRVSFTGLSANLLICPLMEAVVPLGFAAIFTGSRWLAILAGWLLKISARIADWHAALEPSWRVPDPPLWLAAGLAISLIALAAVARRKIIWAPAAGAVLALFVLLMWHPWPPQTRPNQLELTAIDVGQGDSLLLLFPGGARMLVDGGGLLQFGRVRKANLNIGEDVVSPYLWSRGIKTLDVVVATHAHEDHIGGLPAIIENFRPKELWVGANPSPALEQQARRLGIRVLERRTTPPFPFSGAMITIVSPPGDYFAAKPGNNDSLAFRVTYGSRSYLLMGDLEKPMEGQLLAEDLAAHADVLKIGHHGSRTSSIQPFVDSVAPSVAIISAGFENSFGHPNGEVLRRLNGLHAAVLRTDFDGLVTVATDGRRLWLDQMAWHSVDRPLWYPFQADLVH